MRAGARADRKQQRLGLAMLAILFVSFCALLYVMYQLFVAGGSPPIAGARPVNIPANARRFGSLADFEKGSLTPGIPFAITLTEAEINQRLQAEMAKQPQVPFRDVKARVLDGVVEFGGQTRAAGLELGSTVDIRFYAEAGRLRYEITSLSFGPVPVPGPVRQAVADAIDKQIEGQKFGDKWALDDVQARVGAVTLVGHLK